MGNLCESLQLIMAILVKFSVLAKFLVSGIHSAICQFHKHLLKDAGSYQFALPSSLELELMTVALVIVKQLVEGQRDFMHAGSCVLTLGLDAADDG